VINSLVCISEIYLHLAWLIMGWVAVSGGSTPGAGKSISVYNQSPRST